MQQSNQFFATARPSRLFFTVALPGLISMVAMSLYQAFEGGFVGQEIGETALAAITIAMPIVMINFSLADLIGVGSSVPISVALGRKDEAKASNVFTCSVIMIFVTAVFMGALMFFAAPFLADLMNADEELAPLAIRYVRVYALLSPVTTVVFAMDNYLRISGFVKGSMLLNIFMSALTVGFLALFIGNMDKGVEYSALSSCLAMFICAVIAFIPFLLKKSVLRFVRPRFSLSMIKEIAFCGFPTFLNNVAGRVASIIMNAALIRMGNDAYGDGGGKTAVAAYSVLMYASGVVEPMLYGMCDSVQPAIGYNWGAGALDRVRDITKVSFLVCGSVSVLCSCFMLFFPDVLAGIFVNPEEGKALMELSVDAMRIFGFSFMVGWFAFALQGFFASIEKPLPATVISICKSMVFPIVLIFALEPFGLDGLWFNYAGTSILAGILGVILLLKAQKSMKRDIELSKKGD